MVTIKHIAKELSLHYSTISRALNDHPDVNMETKKRVLLLAKKLNYFPNSLAKNFKNQKMNTIGVIVPRIDRNFFASIISSIEEVAYKNNYSVIVAQSKESVEQEIKIIQSLGNLRVAGVIASATSTTILGSHFKHLLKRKIPLLFVDRACENIKVSKVLIDDYYGACQSVEYLIKKGYRRIAHLAGQSNISVCIERARGYKDTLAKYGIKFNKELMIEGGFVWESGYEGLQRLCDLKVPPDAIFTVGIHVAFGVLQRAKEMGLKIPNDFALIGFGDDPITSIIDPPLTTVAQQPLTLGRRSAELLIEQIESEDENFVPIVEKIKPTFIVRKSA